MSATSVRRFAARARAARWVALRPLLGAVSAAAVVALLGWVVLASPLLAARTVEVVGTERVPPAEVAALGEVDLGQPLARVDTDALAGRVEELPMVRSAEVVRAWPSTLEVRVVERVPLAAVPAPDGFGVVDAEGVVVAVLPEPPPDLPLVEVDVATAGADALRETTTVLQSLPDDLRAQVGRAGAVSRDSVTLYLRSGAQVVWGSADDAAKKAEVLRVLLTRPAEVYDVSAPGTPVTR